jgi:hypothetical protein
MSDISDEDIEQLMRQIAKDEHAKMVEESKAAMKRFWDKHLPPRHENQMEMPDDVEQSWEREPVAKHHVVGAGIVVICIVAALVLVVLALVTR